MPRSVGGTSTVPFGMASTGSRAISPCVIWSLNCALLSLAVGGRHVHAADGVLAGGHLRCDAVHVLVAGLARVKKMDDASMAGSGGHPSCCPAGGAGGGGRHSTPHPPGGGGPGGPR